MRYPELTTDEFISFFSTCDPSLVKSSESRDYFKSMLDQFCVAVDELLQEKLLLDVIAAKPEMVTRLAETDHKRYLRAEIRWSKPICYEDLVTNIRRTSTTGKLYDAPAKKLSLDELFLLVCYPFSSRMGGSFGYEFALDGHLGQWLSALKDKDLDEEKADEIREKMQELETRGEYYFREPIHLMPSCVLQELYMAAVNYLSDLRVSPEYIVNPDGRFQALTSLIPELETTNDYGNWVFSSDKKNSSSAINRAPYFRYSELMDTVYYKTKHIIDSLPNGDQLEIAEVYLSSVGIDYRCIKDLNISELDEYCILALLRHIYAFERFGEGYIQHFFHRGYVLKWIKRLKEIDDESL